VAVLICPQHSLASVALVVDVFRMANHAGQPHRFELCRVSEDGRPVGHADGQLAVDGGPECLTRADLVVVPSLWDQGPQAVKASPRLVATLAGLPASVRLASLCSGAYLLAAAGRLDGRRATTHWVLADGLARRYPQVQLEPQANVVVDGELICSGGSLAAIDGCMAALQALAGPAVVQAVSRLLVTDASRGPQSRFTPPGAGRRHQDDAVAQIQRLIEARHAETLSLQALADSVHLTVRTLQRRFQAALHMTPMAYQQAVRLEAAMALLTQGRLSVEAVAAEVGYTDRVAFGRQFKRHTGVTPAAWRQQNGGA
jgi:transcriptional regulator GlxA family with amidase domain